MSYVFMKVFKLTLNKTHKLNYYSSFNKNHESNNKVKNMLGFVREEKYRLAGAVGLLFISSGVTLSVPLLVGKLIDYISSGSTPNNKMKNILNIFDFKILTDSNKKVDHEINKKDVQKFAGLACVIFLIGGLANFGRFYLIQTSGQRIIIRLRNQLYQSLMFKPVEFYDRNQSGELISRLTVDAVVVGEGLSNNISNGLRSGLQTSMGIAMMMYVSPKLSLLSIFVLPPVAGIAFVFGKYVRKISKSLQELVASSTEKANESLSAIRTVKAFCNEHREINDYKKTTAAVLTEAYRDALLRGSFFGLMGMSGNILVVSLLVYGGTLISAGQLTVGELSSFLLYAAYATVSIGGIGSFYTELMKAAGAGSRLWDCLNDRPMDAALVEKYKAAVLLPFSSPDDISRGDIKFEGVSFSYPTRPDLAVLDNFSLCLPRGKMTALVGPSGCGKSSVVSLLLRFYEPTLGQILIGYRPLNDIDSFLWKQKIAAVLQDPVLFSCSIAENIGYGDKSSTESPFRLSEVERVAKLAQVMEFVDTLPNGLDTQIGERGVLLSGGQRQRIAIARALMSDPDIVVLDEAMSALDSKNEWLLHQAFNNILQGRTVLIISHRLAFLRSAYQIGVINKGKLVELGTYDQLSKMSSNNNHGHIFKRLLNIS